MLSPSYYLLCLPARLSLVVLVYLMHRHQMAGVLRSLLFAVGTGFLFLFVFSLRMDAFESSRGATWWHDLRPVHGFNYLLACVLLAGSDTAGLAFLPLLFDFGLGVAVSV